MNITEVPFTLELKKEEFENRVSILIMHQCFRSPLRRNLATVTIKSPGILHLSLSKTRAGRHQDYRSVIVFFFKDSFYLKSYHLRKAPFSRDELVWTGGLGGKLKLHF